MEVYNQASPEAPSERYVIVEQPDYLTRAEGLHTKGDTGTMKTTTQSHSKSMSTWVRIPDGTRVKHRHEGQEGIIDGLTELVTGPDRNPDGRTQYRVNIGTPTRQLVTEDNLCILLDGDDLVIMVRQKEPYRRCVTAHLRGVFADDRFLKSA